jgi:putative hydrolase of the HAD superfamily
MIQGIRHIIFDLGGVLLNLDYTATERAFAACGVENFNECFSQLSQNTFFDDWETGRMNREDFITGMRDTAGNATLTDNQIIEAWNAMLLDFPLRRLQLLQQLRNQYDLFLLSNTNEVHEAAFNDILMQAHGVPSIAHFFDKVYYSHKVGLRKPGREIFQRILEENGLQPEHTLFIDDSPQHIETAKGLGIQTIFLEKGMTIEENVFLPLDRNSEDNKR